METFIHDECILFEKAAFCRTYLVCEDGVPAKIYGYFTLAHKVLKAPVSSFSSDERKKLSPFSELYKGKLLAEEKAGFWNAFIICEIGRNFDKSLNLPSRYGDQLMKYAISKIKLASQIVGGRLVYLDYETGNQKLESYYQRNHFTPFQLSPSNPELTQAYLILAV